MYGETLDSNASISNGNIRYLIGKSIFAVNFLKVSPATIANADIGSLKSLHTFGKYLDHMLVKFEQNLMAETTGKC